MCARRSNDWIGDIMYDNEFQLFELLHEIELQTIHCNNCTLNCDDNNVNIQCVTYDANEFAYARAIEFARNNSFYVSLRDDVQRFIDCERNSITTLFIKLYRFIDVVGH